MSWIAETALPFTLSVHLFFSPIIGREVYVLDHSKNFWKYNLATKQWTELTPPNYPGNYAVSTLVPDDVDNPTKLYCASEYYLTTPPASWDTDLGDAMRISTYDIATNSWTDSARCPVWQVKCNRRVATVIGTFIAGEIVTGDTSGATAFYESTGVDYILVTPQTSTKFEQDETLTGADSGATIILAGTHSFGASPSWHYGGGENIKAIVYQDATHIYCWICPYSYHAVGQYYYSNGRLVCYNPTADTWEVFSSNYYSHPSYGLYGIFLRSAAINAAGTVVYVGGMWSNKYAKYTIATDTYTEVSPGRGFGFAYDKDKLWYLSGDRHGYLDVEDDSLHDNQFTENTELDVGYGNYFGVADDLTVIIAHAKSTAPELMSEGVVAPIVTTDPATGLGAISATPNGTLDDDAGEACECGFEWGLDTGYGTTTPTQSKTTGETFSQPIYGLQPNTTYHFRAFATNSKGPGYGADRSFTTALVTSRAYALAREEL